MRLSSPQFWSLSFRELRDAIGFAVRWKYGEETALAPPTLDDFEKVFGERGWLN